MLRIASTLAVSCAVALAAVAGGTAATSAQDRAAGFLPTRGKLVVGKSLAGVKLGMTMTQVKTTLGGRYKVCDQKAACPDPTWLYFYPTGEPLGAGVRFRDNKVVAIFTLGAVPGWKSMEGVTIADPASKVYETYGSPRYSKCIGFEALSLTQPGVVTSFYLTSGVVYGFALTVPKMTVCQ